MAAAMLATWTAGCVTPVVVQPTGWYCSRDGTDGDVVTSVSMVLDAEGRELGARASSRWEMPGKDVRLLVFQWSDNPGSADPRRQLQLVAVPAAKLRKRLAAVELGFGGGMETLTGFRFAKRQPGELQYQLLPEMEAVLALAREGRGLEVAGFDRTGVALFRIPLDPGVLTRGRAALQRAMEVPHDAIRTAPGACRPQMPFTKSAKVIT